MDSKDHDNERGCGSGDGGGGGGVGVDHILDEFLSYLYNAAPPQDVEPGAFPDGPPSVPPLTTQLPSSSNNSNYSRGATSSPTFVPLDGENDEAPTPRPPEMIAASLEIIEDSDDEVSRPPEMIAASLETIEDSDNEASRPPEILAVSFEGEEEEIIEDSKAARVPEEQIAESVERHSDEEEEEVEETPATVENGGSLMDPLYSSRRPIPTIANTQVGAFSITPTPRRFDDPSLTEDIGQGREEMTISTAHESTNLDANNQLPVVATLVNEEVYAAFLMSDGWSRIPQKYRVVILGLTLVATAAVVAVAVAFAGSQNDSTGSNVATDLVITSTTSTASSSVSATVSPTTPVSKRN